MTNVATKTLTIKNIFTSQIKFKLKKLIVVDEIKILIKNRLKYN